MAKKKPDVLPRIEEGVLYTKYSTPLPLLKYNGCQVRQWKRVTYFGLLSRFRLVDEFAVSDIEEARKLEEMCNAHFQGRR